MKQTKRKEKKSEMIGFECRGTSHTIVLLCADGLQVNVSVDGHLSALHHVQEVFSEGGEL